MSEKLSEKIFRWVVFGGVFSALPFLLSLGFYYISEYNVSEIMYIPELALVAFSIVVNTVSSLFDKRVGLPSPLYWTGWFLTIVCGLSSFALYWVIFGEMLKINDAAEKNQNISSFLLSPNTISMLTKILIVVTVIHLVLGLAMEIISHLREKKNASNRIHIEGN